MCWVVLSTLSAYAGHCKTLAPTWKQLAEEYSGNGTVAVAHVDCTASKKPCEDAEVRGYPTLKASRGGAGPEVHVSAARSLLHLICSAACAGFSGRRRGVNLQRCAQCAQLGCFGCFCTEHLRMVTTS